MNEIELLIYEGPNDQSPPLLHHDCVSCPWGYQSGCGGNNLVANLGPFNISGIGNSLFVKFTTYRIEPTITHQFPGFLATIHFSKLIQRAPTSAMRLLVL